jgi:hypothetical protein
MIKKSFSKINDDDLSLFPDIETYKAELKILDNFKFEKLNEDQIYNLLYDYAKILASKFRLSSKSEFNKKTFYRARLKKKIDTIEDITLTQTYSFPPARGCAHNGRANLKNKSVFYCSDEIECAIRETKPEIGEEGFISFWKGNAKKDIKIGVCLPNDLPLENKWREIEKKAAKYILDNLSIDAKDKFEHIIELYKFISEKFKTEKEPYYISSMISNEFLYGDLWHDYIVYPSLMSKNIYCNLAFHPNSANENLKFEKVLQFKINNIENDKIMIVFGKVGYLENTKMKFREKTKEEIKHLYQNLT